jgi:hypothetical protein
MAGQCENYKEYFASTKRKGRSRWPRGLRHSSAAAYVLGLWVRIPPGEGLDVASECRTLSGTSLCDELIPPSEESCVCVRVRARVRACVCVCGH